MVEVVCGSGGGCLWRRLPVEEVGEKRTGIYIYIQYPAEMTAHPTAKYGTGVHTNSCQGIVYIHKQVEV